MGRYCRINWVLTLFALYIHVLVRSCVMQQKSSIAYMGFDIRCAIIKTHISLTWFGDDRIPSEH